MKCFVSFVCFLSVLVFVSSAPFFPAGGSFSASSSLQLGGSSGSSSSGGGANGLTNILSNIDLPGLLRGVNSFVKLVGVFCPPLSQVLDNVIQNVTSTAFRVFGSAILRSGGLGGGGSGGGQMVSVVLPTFPPDDDDEDEDTDVDTDNETNTFITSSPNTFNADILSRSKGEEVESTTTTESNSAALVLSSDKDSSSSSSSDDNEDDDDSDNNGAISVSEIRLPSKESADVSKSETTTSTERNEEEPNPTSLYTSPVNKDSNLVAKRHVRVTREAEEEEEDQDGAESAPQPAGDLASVDDQDRNKRFLPFGGGVEGHDDHSGGSGNFLFDIIRLVAGSGATEEHDEKAVSPGGVAELDIQKSHEGYSGEGIPGPITRLFVIANRGLANLVQDLILRLAATSEKIVNFKARLITSLI